MLLTFVRVKYGWKIENFDNWKKETFWYSIGYSIKKSTSFLEGIFVFHVTTYRMKNFIQVVPKIG